MEIIGLLFGLTFLFGVALAAGAVLALALRFLPFRLRFTVRVLVAGGILPTLILLYLLVCLGFDVAFGRASLFGDIKENLPNGYVLSALGKMPQDGYVGREGTFSGIGCVGAVAIHDERIAGQYDASHFPCNQQPPKDKPYFVLNSRTGVLKEYASRDQLNGVLGVHAILIPTDLYHAPLTLRGKVAKVMWTALFCLGPIWLVVLFVRLCRRDRLEQQSR